MELTFEQAVMRLEEIVMQMDKGELPLDKALALFEEGAGLVSKCSALLKDAEQKVMRLSKTGGGSVEEIPFGGDEDGTSEKA